MGLRSDHVFAVDVPACPAIQQLNQVNVFYEIRYRGGHNNSIFLNNLWGGGGKALMSSGSVLVER